MSRSDCVERISCPVRALGDAQECVSAVPAIPSKIARPGPDGRLPRTIFERHSETAQTVHPPPETQVEVRLFFDIANWIIRAILQLGLFWVSVSVCARILGHVATCPYGMGTRLPYPLDSRLRDC